MVCNPDYSFVIAYNVFKSKYRTQQLGLVFWVRVWVRVRVRVDFRVRVSVGIGVRIRVNLTLT